LYWHLNDTVIDQCFHNHPKTQTDGNWRTEIGLARNLPGKIPTGSARIRQILEGARFMASLFDDCLAV
jgi:hypothetical protein